MRNATLRRPASAGRAGPETGEPATRTGRVQDGPVMEPLPPPARGRGLLWLAALVVLGLFAAVVGYAYVEGLAGLGGDPPLIHADARPYKHVPNDRGGMAVPSESSSVIDVFRPEPAGTKPEALPPAPDQPADPAQGEARLAAPIDAPDPAALPPLPQAPAAESPGLPAVTAEALAPPPRAEAGTSAGRSAAADNATSPAPTARDAAPAKAVEAPPPALEAQEEPPAPVQTPPRAAPVEPPPRAVAAEPPRRADPPPVVRAERPAGRAAPERAPAPPPANRNVAALEPAPPIAPPAPAIPTAPPALGRGAPAAGGYRLQLLALRSEGAMDQAWSQLRQRFPAVLNGLTPSVERIATVSGTMFRLQAGAFGTRDAATRACAVIQTQGGQCFVVSTNQ